MNLPAFEVIAMGFADAKKFYGAEVPEIMWRKLVEGKALEIREFLKEIISPTTKFLLRKES